MSALISFTFKNLHFIKFLLHLRISISTTKSDENGKINAELRNIFSQIR